MRAARCLLVSLLALWLAGCSVVAPPPPRAAIALPGVVVEGAASPARDEPARYFATTIRLPTYPIENYQTPALDPLYRWPYLAFDRERFWADAPEPTVREYRLLVLENAYLEVSILPELGGRIWQVRHKPSGAAMFYQNQVVKPSPWGPANQLGWLALGGLEWNLPVIEHGYDWGTPWVVQPFQREDGAVGATIATPDDGRLLEAVITVTLRPDVAYLEIAPAIRNRADKTLHFDYWHTAMLAPGWANRPSAGLHFVLPGRLMTVHSTGDSALPGPEARFTWPNYFGRDLSRLGNWDHYLGFFEYPAAHGPFVAVYDTEQDAGAVRVFPAEVARGSKVFGLGWRRAIGSEHFTDDGSSYVELHAGLSPSFFEQAMLPAGGEVSWSEVWYPVVGVGDLATANHMGAIHVQPTERGLEAAVYTPAPFVGALVIQGQRPAMEMAAAEQPAEDDGLVDDGLVMVRIPLATGPDAPFHTLLKGISLAGVAQVWLEDGTGQTVLAYTPAGL